MRQRVEELKTALRERGLSTTGLKVDLANRLAACSGKQPGAKLGTGRPTIDQVLGEVSSGSGSASALAGRAESRPTAGATASRDA